MGIIFCPSIFGRDTLNNIIFVGFILNLGYVILAWLLSILLMLDCYSGPALKLPLGLGNIPMVAINFGFSEFNCNIAILR